MLPDTRKGRYEEVREKRVEEERIKGIEVSKTLIIGHLYGKYNIKIFRQVK